MQFAYATPFYWQRRKHVQELLKESRCGPANKGPLSQPRQFLNPISSNVVRYRLAEGFWATPACLQTDKTSLAFLHHCQSPLCERRPVRATFRQLCFVRMNAHSGDDAILCLFPWKRKLRGIVFDPYNQGQSNLSKDRPVGLAPSQACMAALLAVGLPLGMIRKTLSLDQGIGASGLKDVRLPILWHEPFVLMTQITLSPTRCANICCIMEE